MAKCSLRDKIKLIVLKLATVSNAANDTELAENLHTNPNTFSSWKNTTRLIPIETLVSFCDEYNVSLDWLLRSNDLTNDFSGDDNVIKIPYFDKISPYNFVNHKIEEIASEYIYPNKINMRADDTTKVFALRMNDDQLPLTAPKGSTVIFEADLEVMPYPETYLVAIDGQVVFKRVYKMINSMLCVFSENREVKEDIIDPSDIQIIAKLIGVLRWEN